MTRIVYAVATMDTKGEELAFVADQLRSSTSSSFLTVRTIDVGTQAPPQRPPDVTRAEVLQRSAAAAADGVEHLGRGDAVTSMGEALAAYLRDAVGRHDVAGVIGIGGSGGTALITHAMRALPIGLPKVMVSTVASGNTAPYVDCSDITMMYSVVDVAGMNAVTRQILANAAGALAGMAAQPAVSGPVDAKPTIGMTMFGVTTPCVDQVREVLNRDGHECLVFHATGTGGRAMENLVDSGWIRGVMDLTTTEVADQIVGGIFPCGPRRFETILQRQIPAVFSLGAVDMVNFGGRATVPEPFLHRNLLEHNAQVTLMRTDADENRRIAQWISEKLNAATSPLTMLLPELGVSSLDAPGQPFYDPDVDQILFDEVEAALHQDELRSIIRVPANINDALFAETAVQEYRRLASQ